MDKLLDQFPVVVACGKSIVTSKRSIHTAGCLECTVAKHTEEKQKLKSEISRLRTITITTTTTVLWKAPSQVWQALRQALCQADKPCGWWLTRGAVNVGGQVRCATGIVFNVLGKIIVLLIIFSPAANVAHHTTTVGGPPTWPGPAQHAQLTQLTQLTQLVTHQRMVVVVWLSRHRHCLYTTVGTYTAVGTYVKCQSVPNVPGMFFSWKNMVSWKNMASW